MKKLFSIIAIALLITGAITISQSFAMGELEVYVSANTSALSPASTNVGVTTVIPGKHRIIGYDVFPYDTTTNAELYCGLYDATSTGGTYGHTTTYLFGELEAVSSTDAYASKILPKPKQLSHGLSIRQGTNTVVVVYYERYIP
jgi:hypothetical protein